MLREIQIRDFVLVKEARLSLGPGFVAVTGETGAGKSLLVQALKLLAGLRGGPQFVRDGAKQAVIEGLFLCPAEVQKVMEGKGLEPEEELVIRRIITASGKGKAYINGTMVALKELRDVVAPMLSIVGQHEYHHLLQPHRQRELLDAYAGIQGAKDEYLKIYRRFRSAHDRVKELEQEAQRLEERRSRMEEELEEIEKVAPQPGEEERLEEERMLLRSAKELRQLGEECYSLLYGSQGAAVEVLDQCRRRLERMADKDPSVTRLVGDMEAALLAASEVAADIRAYCDSIHADPSRLEAVEERLYALRRLMQRFGPGLEDVIGYRDRLREELQGLTDVEAELEKARNHLQELGKAALAEALKLTQARRKAGRRLGHQVSQELQRLRMKGAVLDVEVDTPPDPTPDELALHGLDEVTFLFRPNPGHPRRPLAEIASGGELSRVLLTIHSIIGGKIFADTMIFDEIDAGIGGGVAEVVGAKLKELSAAGQVLAVTHFPQIAAMADIHIKVEKGLHGEKTETTMEVLASREARHGELARMLGGDREAARQFAQELLPWE